MNSDLLRRSALGALTTATDAGWDYYAFSQGNVDPALRDRMVIGATGGGIFGNFAGQGISMLLGLHGPGKRAIAGDLLSMGSGILGSFVGSEGAKNRFELQRIANQYKPDALLL